MALELGTQQIKQAVQFIKEHIDKKHNCRVGWALKVKFGDAYEKSYHNIEKVAKAIIVTNEYVKENSLQYSKDFSISKNPSYKKQNIMERNPITTEVVKWLGGIIASVAATVFTTNAKFDFMSKDKPSTDQSDSQLSAPKNRIESLPTFSDTGTHPDSNTPKQRVQTILDTPIHK